MPGTKELPSIQQVMIGKRVVAVEEEEEFTVIRMDDGFSVHILDGGKMIVHPEVN